MKFVVLGICLIYISNGFFGAAMEQDYEELYLQCAEELGYGKVSVETLYEKGDKSLGCATICVMKKTGEWINGKINKQHVLKAVEEEKGNAIDSGSMLRIGECVDIANKEADDCNKGLEFALCFEENFDDEESDS